MSDIQPTEDETPIERDRETGAPLPSFPEETPVEVAPEVVEDPETVTVEGQEEETTPATIPVPPVDESSAVSEIDWGQLRQISAGLRGYLNALDAALQSESVK